MKETKEIRKIAKEIKTLKAKRDLIEDRIEDLEELLMYEMKVRNVSELVAGEYKMRYNLVESSRFDTKAFKKECKDLYDRYVKKTQYMRFSIA